MISNTIYSGNNGKWYLVVGLTVATNRMASLCTLRGHNNRTENHKNEIRYYTGSTRIEPKPRRAFSRIYTVNLFYYRMQTPPSMVEFKTVIAHVEITFGFDTRSKVIVVQRIEIYLSNYHPYSDGYGV